MKRLIYSIAILVALLFVVWLFLHQLKQTPEQDVMPPTMPQHTNISVTLPATNSPLLATSTTNDFVRPDDIDEDHWNRLMMVRQMALGRNQPIEFYARVVDENFQPVEGAKLDLNLTYVDEKMFSTTNFFHKNLGDEVSNKLVESFSDSNGWIRITGLRGYIVDISSISKDGYTWVVPHIGSFSYEMGGQHRVGYAEMEDAFSPDKGYILHLQKIEGK